MNARKRFRKSRIALLILVMSPSAMVAAQTPAPSSVANAGDGQDEIIRVDTNFVTVPVRVVDRDGRYITNLRKEDFQIFEDGVEQEVAFFAPIERPFTIFLVLDLSNSMEFHKENLARAVNAFINLLHPDDQLIAVSFHQTESSVSTLIKPTRAGELQKEIKFKFRVDRDCDTRIYDVVDDSLNRMKKVEGRKAMVLLSDGDGFGVLATAKGTLHKAEEQNGLIYTVQFGTSHGEPLEGNAYMRDLAVKSGGRYYHVDAMANTAPFAQIGDELRRQYQLGYYPKTPLEAGKTRQIRVKVRQPNLVVRARDSYLVDRQVSLVK